MKEQQFPGPPQKRRIVCIYIYKNIYIYIPRHPVIFSGNDWGVQSHSQHNIQVPLPFSGGYWIPRVYISHQTKKTLPGRTKSIFSLRSW